MQLVYAPEFCITIVSNLSWVLQSSQEISKTMVMQNFGGLNKVHYGLCEMVNSFLFVYHAFTRLMP